jgi:hypothetical protein
MCGSFCWRFGTLNHLGLLVFAQRLPFDESYKAAKRHFGFLQSLERQPLEKLVLEVEDQLAFSALPSSLALTYCPATGLLR